MTYLFYAAQALCKFVSGDFSGAIRSAERGISINPTSFDNHFYLAAILAELDQAERAKEQIRRGLRVVPKASLLVIGRAIEGRNSGWAPPTGSRARRSMATTMPGIGTTQDEREQ
jgi:tetratricopeptide (TPR) repeat protein